MRQGVTAAGLSFGVVGSGPPMLWLSGYVVPFRAMEPYVARFASRYTCVLFDARGSGGTPASCLPQTTAAMTLDALSVLREAGFDSAHVHGISLGGMVAQELAIRAPQRVRSLVLGATTAGGFSSVPASLGMTWSNLAGARASIPGMPSLGWRGPLYQAWAASRHDATSRLQRVQAPALVMHGTRDTLLPVANASKLAELLPRAELRLLDGIGHLYPLEAPAESADAVLTWLESQGGVLAGNAPGTVQVLTDAVTTPVRAVRSEVLPWRNIYRAWRPK